MVGDVPGTVDAYNSFNGRDLDVEGFRLHYVDEGEGPVVVMVHGSPISSFAFRHQIQVLRDRFRVIAPDLLCFGKSGGLEGGADFTVQVRALRGFVDGLGVERYRLVAHDWGGPIGLACAAQRPEQVEQLVLVNTSIRPDWKPKWYWYGFVASWLGDLLVVRLNLFSRWLPSMMAAAKRPEVRGIYSSALQQRATRLTALRLERLEGYGPLMKTVVDALPRLQVPTLIFWGHPDLYFAPPELERVKALFPHAEVVERPGAGHFPMEDAPGELTEALAGFLA